MIANENSDGPRVSRVSDSIVTVCKKKLRTLKNLKSPSLFKRNEACKIYYYYHYFFTLLITLNIYLLFVFLFFVLNNE